MINAPDFVSNPGLDILVADDIARAKEYAQHTPSFNINTLRWTDRAVPRLAAYAEAMYVDLRYPGNEEIADASYAGVILGVHIVRQLIEREAVTVRQVVANASSHLTENHPLAPLSLEEYLQLTLDGTMSAAMRQIKHSQARALCYSSLVACLTFRRG